MQNRTKLKYLTTTLPETSSNSIESVPVSTTSAETESDTGAELGIVVPLHDFTIARSSVHLVSTAHRQHIATLGLQVLCSFFSSLSLFNHLLLEIGHVWFIKLLEELPRFGSPLPELVTECIKLVISRVVLSEGFSKH